MDKGLHPRNRHNKGYDFEKLIECNSELEQYVAPNSYGNLSIDFFNQDGVKTLNKTLLKYHYGVEFWDIPTSALIPPIPSRANYIHYVADLIDFRAKSNIKCLDLGVGANAIYPIIGISEYGWNFVGSDINRSSISNAQLIADKNRGIGEKLQLRLQPEKGCYFRNIIGEGEYFDLTICNPPFHDSAESAERAALRKLRNLKGDKTAKLSLNFAGKASELWCKGGELKFITKMIRESVDFKRNCGWFTSLVSKEDNLAPLKRTLKKIEVSEYRIIEMSQGNKRSRILAWRF